MLKSSVTTSNIFSIVASGIQCINVHSVYPISFLCTSSPWWLNVTNINFHTLKKNSNSSFGNIKHWKRRRPNHWGYEHRSYTYTVQRVVLKPKQYVAIATVLLVVLASYKIVKQLNVVMVTVVTGQSEFVNLSRLVRLVYGVNFWQKIPLHNSKICFFKLPIPPKTK